MGRTKGSKNKKPKAPKVHRRSRIPFTLPKKMLHQLATRKIVENLQSIDFGFSQSQCYRASTITIGGEPYFGFIKCCRPKGHIDYTYTRTRVFMPISAWNSFVRDVLPEIKTPPPLQIEYHGDDQRYQLFLFLVSFTRAITHLSRANLN